MEYGRREPLKSAPANEPTAMTMKSIREILAEQGQEGLLNPPKANDVTERVPLPQSYLQQPPHMRPAHVTPPEKVKKPKLGAAQLPKLAENEEPAPAASKSFFARLMGG